MRDELNESLRDYSRAAAGGLVLGMPLLYTMEVWFHGFRIEWWKILFLLAVSYLLVLGFNAIAGFRRERSILELVLDSTATIGIGILLAALVLLVLGRIEIGMTSLRDAAGKIGLEAIPIALGASIAKAELGGGQRESKTTSHALGRVVIGAGGALVFALNIAPTEEVLMLGVGASSWLLLALAVATMLMTLVLVFYADFGGRYDAAGKGILDGPVAETLTGYAVSLAVSFALVWSFGWSDGASLRAIVAMTVVLGGVAAVGAAVARLLVGGGREEGAA